MDNEAEELSKKPYIPPSKRSGRKSPNETRKEDIEQARKAVREAFGDDFLKDEEAVVDPEKITCDKMKYLIEWLGKDWDEERRDARNFGRMGIIHYFNSNGEYQRSNMQSYDMGVMLNGHEPEGALVNFLSYDIEALTKWFNAFSGYGSEVTAEDLNTKASLHIHGVVADEDLKEQVDEYAKRADEWEVKFNLGTVYSLGLDGALYKDIIVPREIDNSPRRPLIAGREAGGLPRAMTPGDYEFCGLLLDFFIGKTKEIDKLR